MTINKEAYLDLKEKYLKVIKLLLEDSKSDPENEPFLSKYSARQILIGMKANIENLLRTASSQNPENNKLTAMYGTVYLYLGMVAIDTEEVSSGEKHLVKCKEIIDKIENLPEAVLIALNMYNQFGILWSQLNPEKSKEYLEMAESLYKIFKESGKTPIDISDLFEPHIETYDNIVAFTNLEKVHTLTLYYLAQIFGKLKEDFKSAVYCHITLQRQLEMNDYEPIDWALNSATLSQFFMEKCGFKQARHHLACSSYILDKYKKELETETENNDDYNAKLETFNHRNADVARCWIKYGIFLLGKSKDRLLAHTENIDEKCKMVSDLSLIELSENAEVTTQDLKNLSFTRIDVKLYEEQIPDQFILHLADAKKVFLRTQDWIKKAKEYYNLDTLASDYIEIIKDQSQLYLNLSFFMENQDSQAKLHKRRIDLLEDIINNVNSQYYMDYCRQIWFELGQAYIDIIEIKYEKLNACTEKPPQHVVSKFNSLIEKCINHYKSFISSFKVNIAEREKIQDDAEKAFLQAYFYMAALYKKSLNSDINSKLKHSCTRLDYYTFIVDYCEKHLNAQELIPMELSICQEMVMILPITIDKLRSLVVSQPM